MGYLTIFEGPDGCGKTTAAQDFAERTGARYVHFYEMAKVSARALPRMYVEAMLPALLGDNDVVFDRSWLSEEPYRKAFRPGQPSRCDNAMSRMLERLALRCGAVLVFCRPPIDVVRKTFLNRIDDELLESTDQLESVYWKYTAEIQKSTLVQDTYFYDYTKEPKLDPQKIMAIRGKMIRAVSSDGPPITGNTAAKVCIIDVRQPHTNYEPWFRWPGVSCDRTHPYNWLVQYLNDVGIRERELCWTFADGLNVDELERLHGRKHYVALGAEPAALLANVGRHATVVPHPRYERNMDNAGTEYSLGRVVRELLDSNA